MLQRVGNVYIDNTMITHARRVGLYVRDAVCTNALESFKTDSSVRLAFRIKESSSKLKSDYIAVLYDDDDEDGNGAFTRPFASPAVHVTLHDNARRRELRHVNKPRSKQEEWRKELIDHFERRLDEAKRCKLQPFEVDALEERVQEFKAMSDQEILCEYKDIFSCDPTRPHW